MTCERCTTREASVHVIEVVEGRRRSLWLCPTCAGPGSEGDPEIFGDDDDLDPADQDWDQARDSEALERFIGQMFAGPGSADEEPISDCPSCGTRYQDFRTTGRLGCPHCYVAFRRLLLPFLGRFHRQVTHLGRFPDYAAGTASRLGEITRTRIALEKAVAAEDFEEAARLRDLIRGLEGGDSAEGEVRS
jgi:protein arginine kinase activator